MADAPAPGAPSPGAPAQGHDDDSARPLSLPALNLLASFRVRQDEDNGEVAARPSLPPHRQVTMHIMQTWTLHEQMLRNPPSDAAQRIVAYRQQYADNQNISFLPAIVSTSTRMHGEFFASSFSTGPPED